MWSCRVWHFEVHTQHWLETIVVDGPGLGQSVVACEAIVSPESQSSNKQNNAHPDHKPSKNSHDDRPSKQSATWFEI